MTINSVSKLDIYLILKIEDYLATLSGGRSYTMFYLKQAYHQLLLNVGSKQFVVINTHKGLLHYNHHPYGISSPPGIFQQTVYNLVQGIPKVVMYIDNALITGPTTEEHLKSLEEVLKHMKEANLKLRKDNVHLWVLH